MLFSVLINYYAHQESLSCTMKVSTPHTLTAFDRLTVPQFSRNSHPIKNFHYCLLHQYLKVENVWVRQFPGGQQTRVHRPPASFLSIVLRLQLPAAFTPQLPGPRDATDTWEMQSLKYFLSDPLRQSLSTPDLTFK